MIVYSQKQNREAQGALREAWDKGLLDPLYFTPGILDWHPPRPDPGVARLLALEGPEPARNDRITDQLDEPAFDTRAQLYQDNSWFVDAPILANTAYEVARFVTAGNETGFVKLAWTYAEIENAVPPPPILELDPRDPFAIQRALGFDVLWFARLEQGQFQRTIPAPYVGPVPQVGGYGFSPLNEWADYRFQWGRTQVNVFWLVPQYHALRLYFWAEDASAALLRIGGRLAGYTQPIDVRVTGWNVAHGF